MNRDEAGQLGVCTICHAEISPDIDITYIYREEGYLCRTCGAQRGGVYCWDEKRWVTPPNVESLT